MTAEPLAFVLRYVRQLADAERLAALPDGELLKRFASQQDDAAFAALVERYGGLVWGACRRLLTGAQDAEDAFQATFLVLARRARALDGRGPLGGWLHTVAYRIALNARAEADRRGEHERRAASMAMVSPREEAGWEEVWPVLDEELQRLPEKYRLPLVLCYLQGKTNVEAAAELGWPAGSMSRRLSRARELLRTGLARRGVSLPAGLLGTVAAGNASAAAPASLLATATRAAVAFGHGHTAVGGAASAQAVALAEGFLKGIVMTKVKMFLAVVLAAALAFGGLMAQRAMSVGDEPRMPPMAAATAENPGPKKEEGNQAEPSVEGTWRVVSFLIEGQKAPEYVVKQLRMKFAKGEVTFKPRFDGQRDENGKWQLRVETDGETWPYYFTHDPAGSPRLAYSWKKPFAAGVTVYDYRFVGDRLELCQDRPLELFSGKDGVMWVLERVPEDGARLRTGDIPIGSLGYRLGDYLTVEGTRAEGAKVGIQTLLVDTVNGKKLRKQIAIEVANVRELPKGTRIALNGYETVSEFIGVSVVPSAMPTVDAKIEIRKEISGLKTTKQKESKQDKDR